MIKVLSCIFHKCLGPFSMMTVKECSKTTLHREWSNQKFLTVLNLGNTLAMTIIFSLKCLKFNADSRNGTRNRQNVFRFWDSCISIGCRKFSQFQTGNSSSAVKMVTNTSNILNITMGNIFQISSL